MKQTVGNACGTIALIHSVANNLDTIELAKESILQSFIKATQEMDADQRAAKLETDVGLSTAHEESAAEGQTEAPDRDDKVDLHFIAFVAKNGSLYQLGWLILFWKCFGFQFWVNASVFHHQMEDRISRSTTVRRHVKPFSRYLSNEYLIYVRWFIIFHFHKYFLKIF